MQGFTSLRMDGAEHCNLQHRDDEGGIGPFARFSKGPWISLQPAVEQSTPWADLLFFQISYPISDFFHS